MKARTADGWTWLFNFDVVDEQAVAVAAHISLERDEELGRRREAAQGERYC